jgi:uncharacterized membrane protein YkvA (DUF1232 family)
LFSFSLFAKGLQKLSKRNTTHTLPSGVEILPPENPGSYNSALQPDYPGEADLPPALPWLKLGVLFLVLVMYVGSPLDLIPDFIPLLGQMDDLLVGGGILSVILKTVMKYLQMKTAFSLRRVSPVRILRSTLARAAVKQVIKTK